MNRRVLVLNHFAAPRGAPGGTRHVELFTRLEGWDSTIIASRRNLFTAEEVESLDGLTGVWTSPYRGNGPSRVINWVSYALTSFVAGMRGRRPDVVYGSSPHLLAGLSAWLLSRVRSSAFVLEVRDLWPRILVEMDQMTASSPVYRLLGLLERFLYRKADRIVVLAPGVARTLEAEGCDPSKLVVIPNGADPEDFLPSAPRDELRTRFGFEGIVATYAGAHGPANGLDLLLDAAAHLTEAGSKVRIVLVGDGAAKPALAARVRSEGLSNVELRDPIPKIAMPDLLAAADIGVHVLADVPLFKYGVSPNKLFDYMAAGRCVITNAGGDVAEIVEGAGAGLAVDPGGLSAGLLRLEEAGSEERARMGDAGRLFMTGGRSRRALAETLASELAAIASEGHRLPGEK